ncbi:MAG: SulP family inorganic anion transporter [Flavobacteriaceae bacterium]|nr:SulP family inorganic anion transporter [Flavobacteriaceae bacterium]
MKNIFSNVKGDLFGGLTAGIVALPLALAFGVSSGLGPSAGLYGAIFLGFFAAFFGGTPTQISGPTAPLTAVSMVVIAGIVQANEGDVTRALPGILTVFLLAGILQILMGISGGGQYIKYIPYPVVSGFMTAIGLIILITQILPVLGYYPQDDKSLIDGMKPLAEERILEKILLDESKEGILVLEDFRETMSRAEKITPEAINTEATSLAKANASGVIGAIKSIPRALKNINFLEVVLALSTVVIIYGFKKITTAIPSTLIALLLVSGVAIALGLNYVPIEKIPSGLPIPRFDIFTNFDFNIISTYAFSAITLAFLGAIDSLLTSVVADNLTKTKHNPNKELVGQGIGNGIAAIFGGLPGAGATIRTVVNIQAGAKTKLSGMTAALLLLIILVALGPLASKIPAAVLAGILITVGFGVMDYRGLKAIPNMPKSEVAIMILVMLLSTFWNLVYAVGIGLILASIIFMKKIGDLTKADSSVVSLKEQELWEDEKLFPAELKDKIYIKHIHGPLFFGSSSHFQELAAQVPDEASYVIIRMGRVPYADQSGLYALEEVLLDLEKRNIHPLLVGVQRQPLYLMQSIDIVPGLIPEDHLFETFNDCMKWLGQNGLTKLKQGK